jgi:hypothetical protein
MSLEQISSHGVSLLHVKLARKRKVEAMQAEGLETFGKAYLI